MVDKTTFYLDLIGRNLDNRKSIIFAALTLVVGFAVTVVQFHLKNELIVKPRPQGNRNAVVFTIVFVVLWGGYFISVFKIDANTIVMLKAVNIAGVSIDGFNAMYFNAYKFSHFLPFVISLIMFLLVMAPIVRTENPSRPTNVQFNDNKLVVTLGDGRKIATPLDWYPRLAKASTAQRANFEIMPMGIHWPDIDEDLSIAGMLKGRPASVAG